MTIKRPLLKFKIERLESFFFKDRSNLTLIQQIKKELEYRKTKRSKKLKEKIKSIKKNEIINNNNDAIDTDKRIGESCIGSERGIVYKKAVQKLVMCGKSKGFLTYAEVVDFLSQNFIAYDQVQSVVSILKESGIPVLTAYHPFSNSVEAEVMTYKNPPMKDFDISLLEGSSVKIKDLIMYISTKIISSKEFEILKSRHHKTLNDVGKEMGVTRERVRQIEAKAIKKTNQFLMDGKIQTKEISNEIIKFFFNKDDFCSRREASRLFKTIDFNYYLFIVFLSKNLFNFLNEYCTYLYKYDGWTKNYDASYIPSESLDVTRISKEFYNSLWPVTVDQIVKNSDLPKVALLRMISSDSRFFIKEVGSVKIIMTTNNVSCANIIRFCIRTNGNSDLSDIVKFSKKEFSKEFSKGRVSSVISSMEDVINIARGRYDFIDNIGVSDSDIIHIKNCINEIILDLQKFISVKLLLKQLKNCADVNFLNNVNEYILNEFLKKDKRFDCKRGFMVGLKSESFTGRFLEQIDEIILLMKEKNTPLTIDFIFNRLSLTRIFLKQNVENLLNANDVFFSNDGKLFYLSELKNDFDGNYLEKNLKNDLSRKRKRSKLLRLSSMLDNEGNE